MELFYLFKTLNRKKWIILACVLVALLTAFLLTMKLKKQYKSEAQIATGFTVSEEMKLTDEKFNAQQIDVKFSNVVENITSPKVLHLLSYNLILHDLTTKKPFINLTSAQKSSDDYKNVNQQNAIKVFTQKLAAVQVLDPDSPEEGKLLKFLQLYGYDATSLSTDVEVSRFQKTDYITIDFTSENAELSAYAANTLVSEFNRYYDQNKHSRTDVSITSLDSLVQQKKALLDSKIAAKAGYLASNDILDVTQSSGSNLQQINGFESQLTEEKSQALRLNYLVGQYDKIISDARNKGVTTVSTDKVATLGSGSGNEEYVTLKKKYNDLFKEYSSKGSSDPEMKKQLDKINDDMRKLNLASETALAPGKISPTTSVEDIVQRKLEAEGQLRAANAKVINIESNLKTLRDGLKGMAASGAGIDKFDKEIQIANGEYTAAKTRLNDATNINGSASTFTQSLVAQPALLPEPSHRGIIIGLAGFAALFLSSLALILIEYVDQSIKTPSQFQRLTHLPLLGTINYIKLNDDILENVNNTNNADGNRNNTFRELLRKLRYEIENSGKHIFLFTSTEAQQGKTTLIQALSYSLSLGKKRVLIIDTNFCNNDLTQALSANPVLEKFQLNGKPFAIEDVNKLITKTKVEGVDTIGCGQGDYTPSEILPKNHLLNYLPQLLGIYDFIFLEGAPVNSFTDTKELIKYSDGMIAVFSSETSLSATDKESIKFFRQNEDKFIGAILNKVQENSLDM